MLCDLTIIINLKSFWFKKKKKDTWTGCGFQCAMMNTDVVNFYVLNQRQQNSKLTGVGGAFLSRTNINRDQVIKV